MSLISTRLGGNVPALPGPMPLPSLISALSRRAALFGAMTLTTAQVAALPAVAGVLTSEDTLADADRRLVTMADTIDALQARADRHAADAGSDPADPYTQTVAEMDLFAAGMAALPAETMGGVLAKLRAMAVPTVREDDEAHGLALSVCRDLRRLQAMGVHHA